MPIPLFAVLLVTQAMAPSPACTAEVPPPPAFAAWSSPVTINAAPDVEHTGAAILAAGATASIALKPAASIRYVGTPSHPAPEGSFGGLVTLSVTTAGRYQVALGAAAWIDVMAGDHPLTSVGHGHGPMCSGIRKIVAFDLAPGHYVVQLSGAPSATIKLLAALQPK